MKKKFSYEFEDTSDISSMRYEYSEKYDEKITVEYINDVPMLGANKSGYLFLAKVFLKLALGNYHDGFHFHLHEDIDSDKKEIMIIGISEKTSV